MHDFTQRPDQSDPTCWTSPIHITEYHWPHGWGAWSMAFSLFACLFLGVMCVWMWWHYRPCSTCGEYQHDCRCKARTY